ncbi:MAG: hypothetical protein R3352_10125, partial [Salinisphaeraceae bacterium]|nr:hypothetical protein [Salinisphaeraceae bacterium]
NPHVHYSNTTNNGYLVLELTPEQVKSEWWHVTEIHLPEGTEFNARTATAQAGNNRIDRLPV